MAEINLTSMVIGFFIFIFILLSGALFVTTGFINYDITDTNELEDFDNAALQGNLTDLGYNLDKEDDELNPSPDEQNEFVAVFNILKKAKAIKGIKLTIQNTLESVLSFVPAYVWWLIGSIVGIIIVLLGIAAVLRYKP
jgi:uncharacterized membrane protein